MSAHGDLVALLLLVLASVIGPVVAVRVRLPGRQVVALVQRLRPAVAEHTRRPAAEVQVRRAGEARAALAEDRRGGRHVEAVHGDRAERLAVIARLRRIYPDDFISATYGGAE